VIDFPASPTIGQQFTAAGVTWIWDGVKWLPSGLSPTVVPGINDNRIINGDCRIDQRNNGAAGTASGYTVDRWAIGGTLASGQGTWGRNIGSFSGPVGFPYYLGYSVSAAITPAATDTLVFQQALEGNAISDFAWGTAQAQPVTLSFWVNSNLIGAFGGSIRNYAGTRSYPFSFSIPTANTWVKIAVTIPGDSAGTWVMSGTAGSLIVAFDLGSGNNFRGPANVWAAPSYLGVTGSVSLVTTLNAAFFVTGVKLEIGNVATSFNRYSLAKSLADCQRYFYKPNSAIGTGGYAPSASGLTIFTNRVFPVTMRAAPTQSGATFNNVNATPPGLNTLSQDIAVWVCQNVAPGVFQLLINAGTETYDAEL
jgi:hypothetical protein